MRKQDMRIKAYSKVTHHSKPYHIVSFTDCNDYGKGTSCKLAQDFGVPFLYRKSCL
jgi:hypothetical protein